MRQSATVVSTKGNIAEIRVERASMCDGCVHKNCDSHTCAAGGLLGAGKTMVTRAYNEIGARAGDVVTVETATKKVLSYAALVFLMPILVCAVFYAIGNAVFQIRVHRGDRQQRRVRHGGRRLYPVVFRHCGGGTAHRVPQTGYCDPRGRQKGRRYAEY